MNREPTTTGESLLRLERYERRYGHRVVLHEISLDFAVGEFVCLMGPNGAGKTSLIEAILSHHRARHSHLYFRSLQINGLEAHTGFLRQCAMLGHDPGLLYDLSAIENLQYFADISCAHPPALSVLNDLLGRVGLQHRATDRVREFSRGMRQRLGLARCLVHDPAVLFLDEPLTGLDEAGIAMLQQLLLDEKSRGAAGLIITHDEAPFEGIADRYIFLKNGMLAADIPASRYTETAKKKVRDILSAP